MNLKKNALEGIIELHFMSKIEHEIDHHHVKRFVYLKVSAILKRLKKHEVNDS